MAGEHVYNIQIGGGDNAQTEDEAKAEAEAAAEAEKAAEVPPFPSWKKLVLVVLRVFNVCAGILLGIGLGLMETYALKDIGDYLWYFRFIFRLLLMLMIIVIIATDLIKPNIVHKAFPQYGHTKSWLSQSITMVCMAIAIYSDPLLGVMQDRQGDSKLVHVTYPGVISVNAIWGITGIAYFIVSVCGGVKLKAEYYGV